MLMMSLKDAARELGVDKQTARKYLPVQQMGRRVLVPTAAVRSIAGRPNGRTLAWEAMRFWNVNERLPLCDLKADMLASTASAFLIETPEGEITSTDFVAYALANPPGGGGAVGDGLRADILAEAKSRNLI